jgi:ketosteroid isomerase-like protein
MEMHVILAALKKLGVCKLGMIVITMVLSTPYGWAQSRSNLSPQDDRIAQEIDSVLSAQAKCWNNKDINGFMETYWKSENLTFSGGGKTTRGWQATLERYKTRYPAAKMGSLRFDDQEITLLSDSAALVLGSWHLDQEGTKSDGNFSLVMRKIDGAWKIIHDHSSVQEETQ